MAGSAGASRVLPRGSDPREQRIQGGRVQSRQTRYGMPCLPAQRVHSRVFQGPRHTGRARIGGCQGENGGACQRYPRGVSLLNRLPAIPFLLLGSTVARPLHSLARQEWLGPLSCPRRWDPGRGRGGCNLDDQRWRCGPIWRAPEEPAEIADAAPTLSCLS
jgi:hypothetical protein